MMKRIIGVRVSCACSRGSITLGPGAQKDPSQLEYFMESVRKHGCVPLVEDVLVDTVELPEAFTRAYNDA